MATKRDILKKNTEKTLELVHFSPFLDYSLQNIYLRSEMRQEILTFTLGSSQELKGIPLPPEHELRNSVRFKVSALFPHLLEPISPFTRFS